MMIEHWMHRRDFLERNQLTPLKIVARRNKLPVRCCKLIVENQQQLTDGNDDIRYSELTTTTTTTATARTTNTLLGYHNQRPQDLSIGSYCHSTSSDEDEEEDDNYEMMNLNHPSRYVSDYSVLQYFESLKRRNRQLSFDDDDDNDDNDEDRQPRENDHSSSDDSPHVTITPIPEKRIRAHLAHLRLSTSKIRHLSTTSPSTSSSSSSSNLMSSSNNVGSMVRCPGMSSPSVTLPTYSFAYCRQKVKKEEEHEPKEEEPTADTTTTVVSPSSMCTATCTNTSTSASSSTTTSTTTSPLTSSCTMNTTTLMHLKFELQQQTTNIEASIEQEKIQNSTTTTTTTTTNEQATTDNWWEIESDISQIEPNIYLGTYKGSLDKQLLQSHGITHIIQVVEVDQNPHRDEFQYFNVCVSDRVEEDLSTHFKTCSDYIHRVLSSTATTMTTTTTTTTNNNGQQMNKVFVHCGAGISRSAALVIAYLMKYDHRFEGQFRAAYEYLKLRRMQVKPNRGFKKQLELYQQMLLLQRTSVTVVTSGEVSSSNVQLEVGCSN